MKQVGLMAIGFALLLSAQAPTHAQTVVSKSPDTSEEEQAPQSLKRDLASGPTLVFDATTGEVLHQDRAGEPWYPASLTKLMTAYIIFQRLRDGRLRLEQEAIVSDLAAAQEPSKIGIPKWKTVTIDFALQSLLVYSANDMAYVLAEAASGTHERFADEMNAVAKTLGLTATHFVNPNGLFDPRQITSARDIGVLSAVIVNEFPQYSHYFSQAFLQVGKKRLSNRNALIRIMPEADGMKTGFVCNSGYNLVGSSVINGRKLISVVLGAKSGYGRSEIAKALMEKSAAAPPNPDGLRVAEILNLPQGAIVPADMTPVVCKSKTPVRLADGNDMRGWAISFGTYDTMVKADMALRGRLLSPYGLETKSSVGVVRLPEKAGFAAMMWNMQQDESLRLCNIYRSDQAHCDVMPPAFVEQLAQHSKLTSVPPPQPIAEGSEEAKPKLQKRSVKKPTKKKRVRKTLR